MTKRRIVVIIILLGILISAGIGLYLWTIKDSSKPETQKIVQDQIFPTDKSELKATTTIQKIVITSATQSYPGSQVFMSPELGIAFNYLASADGGQFKTLESGNKVYIYESKLSAQSGQFVEVFKKDPEDSLSEAIRKKFLAGKSANDCFVVSSQAEFPNYPASFQAVEISFPKPTDDQEPWWSRGDACSSDYAQTNGIRYFLGDTKHPDKFLFFDIGQYSIIAGTDLTWQDTIRFLD